MRDRLAYRTSTMGLIRADLAAKAMPTPGLGTAEDLIPGLRLWFSRSRIVAADVRHPYVVASDARDRVTEVVRSMNDELAFVTPLVEDGLWRSLGAGARISIVAKLLRVQVIPALARRDALTTADVAFAADAARQLLDLAPGAPRILSRDDAELVRELIADSPDPGRLRVLAGRSMGHLSVGGLATSHLRDGLRRDAPVRYLGASVLARYRR